MRKHTIAMLFTLILSGCTTTGQYGNFVSTTANQEKLAVDTAQQLVILYPPAKTHLELHQATPDAFGLALVNILRERGYAILEFNSKNKEQTAAGALPLHYVLDKADTSNLYRLTLKVGNQSITRPYLEQNGTFVPAGYWTRKE
ncbi:conjugal transfer protein TrbH [Neisseriaceae bacterium ESL0693]|nr:conjugal transfer protein TrbH [Neisseriaceae bacterium ESL0693]